MRSRRFARRWIPAGLAAAGAAAFLAAGCIFDSGDGPVYREIQFEFVRFPSVVPAGQNNALVEAGFLYGWSGCWVIEQLSLSLTGDTLRLSGTGKLPDRGMTCTDNVLCGRHEFLLPPLAAGLYWIQASRLSDTLRVAQSDSTGTYRILMQDYVWDEGDGCAWASAGTFGVGLSNLPDSIPASRVIIWADQIDEDPCERETLPPECFDYFASVRRIEAVPQ